MKRFLSVFLVGFTALAAGSAEARFGKKKSQPEPASSHEAEAVESNEPPSPSYSTGYTGYRQVRRSRPHWSVAYHSAVFVPAPVAVAAAPAVEDEAVEEPRAALRVGAGVEGQGFVNGFTLGVNVGLEGERWGLTASGQNIAVRKDDGTPGFDHLQVATAHVTFAFLTGRYGRLRVEGGADAAFAPDLIVVGPTAGLSGTIWIGGPFAIEGSTMVTPWPYLQLDAKLGAALGLGPVGLRAGVRLQVLDDRGLVGGVPNRDILFGPYVGAAVVF